MTSPIDSFIQKVLSDARRATKRPWIYERVDHDGGHISYEFFESNFSFALYEINYDEKPMQAKFDADYIQTATNSAESLALALQEALQSLESVSNYFQRGSITAGQPGPLGDMFLIVSKSLDRINEMVKK